VLIHLPFMFVYLLFYLFILFMLYFFFSPIYYHAWTVLFKTLLSGALHPSLKKPRFRMVVRVVLAFEVDISFSQHETPLRDVPLRERSSYNG
jgi:hypothetical protein